jgi:hypothetical protein
MARTVMLVNPNSGLTKKGRYGYSWTYLFFGWWVPLFRGEIGIALLHLIATVCTFGIWQIVFSFMYNRQYMTRLLDAGYKLHDDEYKMNDARAKLGIVAMPASI